MKTKFKHILGIVLLFLIAFSCQEEQSEITEPDNLEVIEPGAQITTLMTQVTTNSGAADNVLDNSSCYSIELPVTVIANNITITIESVEDYDIVEAIFEELQDDEDDIDFLFPITVVGNDYSEIVIESLDELEALISECTTDPEIIECVNIQYPISFSIFNVNFDIVDVVTVNNDEELYEFIENLEEDEDDVITSLNFPVTLVYADGNTEEVFSNEELSQAFESVEDSCEDDNDDVVEDCDTEDITEQLQECYWVVESYNGDDHLSWFNLSFLEDGSVKVINDNEIIEEGTWNISENDNEDAEIIISQFGQFSDLNGNWMVTNCDDDDLTLIKEVDGQSIEMVIEQECEDDNEELCSAQQVVSSLQECFWYPYSNVIQNNDNDYYFVFNSGGELLVQENPTTVSQTGSWEVVYTDNGPKLNIELANEFAIISTQLWELYECEEGYLKFVYNDQFIEFERECEYSIYDCDEYNANIGETCVTINGEIGTLSDDCECEIEDDGDDDDDDVIIDCDGEGVIENCDEVDGNLDGFSVFNLNAIFDDCENDNLEYSFYETLADAQNNTNPIASTSSYINTSNPQTIYSRITVPGTAVFEVFEHSLYVYQCEEDCTSSSIFSNLLECEWEIISYNGDDNLQEFELVFQDGNELIIDGLGQATTDFWDISDTSQGVLISFANISTPGIQDINGEWMVVECDNGFLQLQNGNSTMLLEQDCE